MTNNDPPVFFHERKSARCPNLSFFLIPREQAQQQHLHGYRQRHGYVPIPNDINETYISSWLQQNQHLLRPLELLHRRRQKKWVSQPQHSQNSKNVPIRGAGKKIVYIMEYDIREIRLICFQKVITRPK